MRGPNPIDTKMLHWEEVEMKTKARLGIRIVLFSLLEEHMRGPL